MKRTRINNLSWYRRWRRSIAAVTLFAFLIQGTSIAWAQALSNAQITSDLDFDAMFQRVLQEAGYQYEGVPYITDGSAIGQIKGMESLRSELLANHPASLGKPKYVPIGAGEITTIIPVYPNYKPVGTSFVTNRYVRQQVQQLLGRQLVDSDVLAYQSESHQLATLYGNAYQFALSNPNIKYGDPLAPSGYSRVDAPKNMIWPERRLINGEEVLVPVLYLAAATVADRKITDHTVEFNGSAEFASIHIEDVNIKLGRQGFLSAVDDLTCSGCTIENENGNVTLVAGGTFNLLSGLINAEGNITIGAKGVEAETLLYRYDAATGQGTRYGEIAGFNAQTGDINIRSYADIVLNGVQLNAGTSIKLGANGDIYIGTQEISSASTERYGRNYEQKSTIEYLVSKLSAEETIQLIANGDITIDGAEIVSDKGHIELLAGLGITIEDELAKYQYYKKGKYGNKKVQVSAYQTVAIRALLDAGKSIRLHSALGDITLRATDFTSVDGTSVTADGGGVNLLMTVETDHYSLSSVYKGLFKTKVRNEGHNIETGVPNTIVGGLTVEALNGVQIQYEGDPELSLDQQLDKLSELEGMGWMAEIRAMTPDANWHAIELQYEKWKESNTSISPAFAAVISIAVAIATSGAGASTASFIMGTTATQTAVGTAMAVGIAAGTQALLSQVVLAVANGAVNGDVGQAMEDMASSDTLKSLAIAMVTAGALHHLNTTLFQHIDPTKVDPGLLHNAEGSLSLLGQSTQALTYAATRAGVSAVVNGESFGDFTDMFTKNLLQHGVKTIGATMANQIRALDITDANGVQTAVRYIAHAGAGCIIGSAQARISSGDTGSGCGYGALGGATGEIVADIHKSSTDVAGDVEKLEAFLEKHGLTYPNELTAAQINELLNLDTTAATKDLIELRQQGIDIAKLSGAIAAFVAGGDASSVEIASVTAENAAENNALFLIPIAIGLLKVIDIAMTANELWDIYQLYQDDKEKGEAALVEWAGDEVQMALLSQVLPGAKSFDVFVKKLGELKLSKLPEEKARQIGNTPLAPERIDNYTAVKPSASGNIGKGQCDSSGCQVDLTGLKEKPLVSHIQKVYAERESLKALPATDENRRLIAQLDREIGGLTENLSDMVLKRNGWEVLPGGKVGSNNGFDHIAIARDSDGTLAVLVLDSKQMDGGFRLSNTNHGVQLSDSWIGEVSRKLETKAQLGDMDAMNALSALEESRATESLKRAVFGLDKKTGDFHFFPVEF